MATAEQLKALIRSQNRQHPLIEPVLAAADTQAVQAAWVVAPSHFSNACS